MSIDKYLNRVSVRDFTGEKINQDDLKKITDIINNSPTSQNAQQFSAIIITDEGINDFISTRNFGQKHISQASANIIFLADRTRVRIANGDYFEYDHDMQKNDFLRSVIDATIASTYIHDALMEMGFGTVYIGGVSSFGDELSEKLNIPKTAFPVIGLSFGKTEKVNDIKPKINKVYVNKYDQSKVESEIKEYDKVLNAYYMERNENTNFSSATQENNNPFGPYKRAFSKSGKFFDKN